MTIFLEIETRTTGQDAETVLNTVEQLWIDLERTRNLREMTPPDLEDLVSAVIGRSLGKR